MFRLTRIELKPASSGAGAARLTIVFCARDTTTPIIRPSIYSHLCRSNDSSKSDLISSFLRKIKRLTRRMFYGAEAFNQDIGNWTVDSVTNMGGMFWDASAFNHDIGGWAVESVTNMAVMFWDASVFNQDLSGWAVHSVTDMRDMFNGA